MTKGQLSINRTCIAIGSLLVMILASATVIMYKMTEDQGVVFCMVIMAVLIFACIGVFIAAVRRKLTVFSDILCSRLDSMMMEDIDSSYVSAEEGLFFKISHRITRLYEVMRENRRSIARERADLQELISDVSHQVKTPIANLKMIDATLLEQTASRQKQREFLEAMAGQLDKLDFLMQALVKTSRLETGVISLDKKKLPVYDTLAAALGGILLNAEKKKIQVVVNCPEDLEIAHDRKWTSEALFNILDNGVKYTHEGGQIRIAVEKWEFYLKIDIADNGKGICEKNQAKIFKRFYREEEVHDIEGIGIGLYLAREIITMQGGYMKVTSEAGHGSTFSVFLPLVS